MTDSKQQAGYDNWQPDMLNEQQARLSLLADAIRQEVLDSRFASVFDAAQRQTLMDAVTLLTEFNHWAHQRMPQPAVTPERERTFAEALRLAEQRFPQAESDPVKTAAIALAIEASIATPADRLQPGKVTAALHDAVYKEEADTLRVVITEQYRQMIAILAHRFLAIGEKHINTRYVEDWALRVRSMLDNPTPKQQDLLAAVRQRLGS